MKNAIFLLLSALLILSLISCDNPSGGEKEEGGGEYDIVINLTDGTVTGTVNNAAPNIRITVTDETILIKGKTGGNNRSVVINTAKATEVSIDNGTEIRGSKYDEALTFYGNHMVTITGGGSDITIKGYDEGYNAVYSAGSLTLNGTFGSFSGGDFAEGKGGYGIRTVGGVIINGTTGSISGGNSDIGDGGHGISTFGDVTISGKTGVIKGGDSSAKDGGNGIDSDGTVTLNKNVPGVLAGTGGTAYAIVDDTNLYTTYQEFKNAKGYTW